MSEWISVDDRLPEPAHELGGTRFSEDVLSIDADGICMVDYVCYPHGLFGADTAPKFMLSRATRWMPLPEPPC